MSLPAWGAGRKEHDKRELSVITALKKNMEGRRVFAHSQQGETKTQACKFHEDVAYLTAIE